MWGLNGVVKIITTEYNYNKLRITHKGNVMIKKFLLDELETNVSESMGGAAPAYEFYATYESSVRDNGGSNSVFVQVDGDGKHYTLEDGSTGKYYVYESYTRDDLEDTITPITTRRVFDTKEHAFAYAKKLFELRINRQAVAMVGQQIAERMNDLGMLYTDE